MTSVDTRYARVKAAMGAASHGMPPLQRQDSLTEQLTDLWIAAAKMGMYDAADWLWKHAKLEEQ